MTNWLPDISTGDGPLYLRLADAIETAIGDGVLPAGAKLPPQRNLAFDLGVTIGTISRAYAAVHERGLVSGEVGRGTYVNDRRKPAATAGHDPVAASLAGTRAASVAVGQYRLDTTAAPDVGQGAALERHIGEIVRQNPLDVANYSRTQPDHWLAAGVSWLSSGNWRPVADSIVPTLGAHAAIMSVVTAMTAPGDRIVFENLTYSQVSRSVTLAGRRIALAETDADGLVPEDFEKVCAQQHPKLVFLMPSAQNPTCATLPMERRRAIAEIARRHNVWIIEDNLYGAMRRDDLPLIAELAPDITFVVGGLSKSVAAGIRGGWAACPAHLAARVRIAHRMMTGGQPFLLAELCARLVMSGEADQIRRRCVAEINRRHALVTRTLAGYEFESHPDTPFLWLRLPEPWLSGTFRIAALHDGVLIDDEDEFKAGRMEKACHRVRVSFPAPATHEELGAAVSILRGLLDNGAAGYDSVA